jgi:hypothetical protein
MRCEKPKKKGKRNFTEEEFKTLEEKNNKLIVENESLKQKLMYHQFEIKNIERKMNFVDDRGREILMEKMGKLSKEQLLKFSTKLKENFPHFIHEHSKQIDIPISKCSSF